MRGVWPNTYSVWRHKKTGHLYVVLGVAVCATNAREKDKETSVIYSRKGNSGVLYYRELNEFLDGRFEEIE